jgi:hypothetical protein
MGPSDIVACEFSIRHAVFKIVWFLVCSVDYAGRATLSDLPDGLSDEFAV